MPNPTSNDDDAQFDRIVEIVFQFQELLLAHVHGQPQTVANTYTKRDAETLADEIQTLAGNYGLEKDSR